MKLLKAFKLHNKKGFTLIELIVSVAIFAIIASPLIHSLITSQQTSRKSHHLGDATLASINIIETVKAWGANVVLDNPAILHENAEIDEDTGVITLRGYNTGIMATFDIRVTLRPDEFVEINGMEITDYSPMHGIFAQSAALNENPDILAKTDLGNQAALAGIDSITPENIKRTITVKTHENEAGNEARVTVTYFYTYDTYSFTREYEFFREKMCEPAGECVSCIRCVNKNVYVCYQPRYGIGITDVFEIDNSIRLNLSVFLVNQSLQNDYTHSIKLTEGSYATLENLKTQIYANFDKGNSDNIDIFREAIRIGGDKTTGELVSRSQHDRMFSITVEVFARGQIDKSDGRPMLTTREAAQLDGTV